MDATQYFFNKFRLQTIINLDQIKRSQKERSSIIYLVYWVGKIEYGPRHIRSGNKKKI